MYSASQSKPVLCVRYFLTQDPKNNKRKAHRNSTNVTRYDRIRKLNCIGTLQPMISFVNWNKFDQYHLYWF